MSRTTKKSLTSTLTLILLGMIALFGGVKSLVVLIPAALLVWFTTKPRLGTGRN